MKEEKSLAADAEPRKREALPVTWPGVVLVVVSLGIGVWVNSVVGTVLFVVGYAWLGHRHRLRKG